MKNILKLLAFALLFSSCETDLEQDPILEANLNNLSDVNALLLGGYVSLKVAANEDYNFGEIRSDNSEDSGEDPWIAFDDFSVDLANNELIENYWNALYKTISIANITIENLSLVSDQDERDDIEGQARFLRALSYFKLVKAFGDVPLTTSGYVDPNNASVLTRVSSSQIYSLVETDLIASYSLLPETTTDGKPTVYAAKALLGKVYLYQEDYAEAITMFEDVIDSDNYEILSSYADVFDETNELNNEIIFAVQYDSTVDVGDAANTFSAFFTDVKSVNNPTEDDDVLDAAGGFSTVYAGDDRLDVCISDNSGEDGECIKYGEINADTDLIEIRYADVLLMYAEALNENGSTDYATTLALLDDLRIRGGQDILDPAIYNTTALVRDAIKFERRIELAFESHRWFDLVRWGDALDTMGSTVQLLFPIPVSEINATSGSITQNPGYN